MIKLLLIEDDINLGYIIKSSLEDIIGDYEVTLVYNGKEGLDILARENFDIIVSDVEMPQMNGIEMVSIIRQSDLDIPIIFASAKTSPKDVTLGYNMGVNNYIKKPFIPEELDAHIKALLKLSGRVKNDVEEKKNVYNIGEYIFDSALYCLEYNNERQSLTSRETGILKLLCDNKGKVVKRDEILHKYWGTNDFFVSRSLDVFISKMRKYLSKDPRIGIKTIKGIGLILDWK